MSNITESKALTSEEITNITRQTNYGTWRFQKGWKPLHIADAEGCWFTDGAGKRSNCLMLLQATPPKPAPVSA
jgi:taurine--2-oxoglutarate transaminase